jgi:hypothetical protein
LASIRSFDGHPEVVPLKTYVSNKASRVELWDIHRELQTAMTELMTNRNYGTAAEILRNVDRRMADLLNGLTVVSELPGNIAIPASGKPVVGSGASVGSERLHVPHTAAVGGTPPGAPRSAYHHTTNSARNISNRPGKP